MSKYTKISDVQKCIRDCMIKLIDEGKENVEITEFKPEIQKRLIEIPVSDLINRKEFIFRLNEQFKSLMFVTGDEVINRIKNTEKEMIDIDNV